MRHFFWVAEQSADPPRRLLAYSPHARDFRAIAQCMGGFRTFTANAKKFSPKKQRKRVGAMTNKPCPLHDEKRKRPCKQSVNALDVCPHFQPNRSRCAPAAHGPAAAPARLALRVLRECAMDGMSARSIVCARD